MSNFGLDSGGLRPVAVVCVCQYQDNGTLESFDAIDSPPCESAHFPSGHWEYELVL